ncbi:MAG: helix-turn-helix domain-containing protein [Campylobacterales bacterium]|nr:helix-turn-helix domain-containing protein [Campylobacterales bacterium]
MFQSVQSSTIRSLINRIRSKLHEPLIENVRGFGYTLKRYTPA